MISTAIADEEEPARPWSFCSGCRNVVQLPHNCAPSLTYATTAATQLHTVSVPRRPEPARDVLDGLRRLVASIRAGDYPTRSRDFGRGMAYATRLITDYLEEHPA